jgi:hypothetical protein
MTFGLSEPWDSDFSAALKLSRKNCILTAQKLSRNSGQSLTGNFPDAGGLLHFSPLTESSVVPPRKSCQPKEVVRAESVWTVCT